MNIVYCINNNYVPYVLVSICSLLENNRENRITIQLLMDYISEVNEQRIKRLVESYNQSYIIHLVNDEKLRGLKETWSIYAWYRCLIPEILSNESKCLYLDADVVIAGDISDVYDTSMNEKSIAAVIDIETLKDEKFKILGYDKSKKYICSGVMIMNLDYWRSNDIANKVFEFSKENEDKIAFPDQDAINYVCQDSKMLLPLKYGILNPFVLNKTFMEIYKEEIIDFINDPRIIHYAGFAPWKKETNRHFMRDYFFKYNKLIGSPVKSKHILSGFELIKFKIKRVLNFLHIIKFQPCFCTPIVSKKKILSYLMRN